MSEYLIDALVVWQSNIQHSPLTVTPQGMQIELYKTTLSAENVCYGAN